MNNSSSAVAGEAKQMHVMEGNSRKRYLMDGNSRKRYRTVVPRRVYLDLPAQQFDEEQDSFLAVRSDPEARCESRTGVSLIESFEVATLNTF